MQEHSFRCIDAIKQAHHFVHFKRVSNKFEQIIKGFSRELEGHQEVSKSIMEAWMEAQKIIKADQNTKP